MEEMVNELNVEGLKIGLEMNMSKTQVMVNQWCDAGTIKLAGKSLERVESYVYLGREVNMTNNITPEINRKTIDRLRRRMSHKQLVKMLTMRSAQ
ncbi:hypothetical protein TELCIR_19245 [Teladorsagia circumcincta]|uniref:Reverse transcriptase domain-containing protein n=1 Tax=Teladorsagia circumcincta TaxID=45464 RepID=A0A2G9TMX7_TELCI|nr:hypothetical protein TELCIR_19245 [Teladorsagia circumcincta]